MTLRRFLAFSTKVSRAFFWSKGIVDCGAGEAEVGGGGLDPFARGSQSGIECQRTFGDFIGFLPPNLRGGGGEIFEPCVGT